MRRRLLALAVALSLLAFPVQAAVSVPLTIQEALYPGRTGVARTDGLVTVGIPLPDSSTMGVTGTSTLGLTGATKGQFRVLGTWPSGRAKWVLVDTLATVTADGTNTELTLTSSGSGTFGGSDLGTDNGTTIAVVTGTATFTVRKAHFNGIDAAVVGVTTVVSAGASDGFVVVGPDPTAAYPGNVTCTPDSGGTACTTEFTSANDAGSTCSLEENGPVRAVVLCTYDLEDGSGHVYLHGTARLHFVSGSSAVRVVSILRNADDGSSNTFETAYKGHRGYELRTTLNITTTSNTYTIATHTATPTTGTLTSTDTASLYQATSSLMQYIDNPVAYQITDTGYTIVKNGSAVQTGTAAQGPEGWCDIQNGAGVGLQIGIYQLAGSYPKGCRFGSAGQVAAVSILPAQSTTPYYMEWPAWNELTDVWLNFHTSAPASLPNAFLAFQHPLLARATIAHYNSTATIPTTLLDPLVEDTYTTTVTEAASPSITTGAKWAIANATQVQDFGITSANFPLQILRSFSWNLESEYRYGYLLNWLTRGWTGRYLQARHQYEYQVAYMLAHSDGFNWRTGHGAPGGGTINGFGHPNITSGNSTKGTHGGNEHNWRDQEHGFWYGQPLYYFMSGDEFQKAAIVDQQSDWFLTDDTYQDGGSAGSSQIDVSGTTVSLDSGSPFTAAYLGQVLLIGTSKTGYEVASVTDPSHLELTTSGGTQTNVPFIVFNGLFNARSIHTQLVGGVRFAEFLDATSEGVGTTVLGHLQHLLDEQVFAKGCASGYPSGCSFGVVGSQGSWQAQGLSRERGFHWGAAGGSGNWCGVANTYRVNSLFQESLMAEALLELSASRGAAWAEYDRVRDLAYGIAQWALTEGYDDNGLTSHATNGFRFGLAFDVRNDCQDTTAVWSVSLSGTAVTRLSGPNFVSDGTWTGSYALMYDGSSAFIVNGTARTIASVTDSDHLTLTDCSGCTGTVSAYWREENYDEANPNGSLTTWAPFIAAHVVTGAVDWQTKLQLAMQRSMVASGTTFRDAAGYHLMDVIGRAVQSPAAPMLTDVTLTGFSDNGGGSYTLSWTPVTGATYRVKWGRRTLVDWIGFNPDTNAFTGDPATTMNWFAAEPVRDVPVCGLSCSVTIGTGVTSLIDTNFRVKSLAGVSEPDEPTQGPHRLRFRP